MNKYRMKEKVSDDINKFKVTIKADSNDGDYIIETSTYGMKEFDEYVIDGLIDLKNNYSDRHQLSDYPNDHDLNIPYNGWDGYCHTLTELIVEYIDANGRVWDVEIGSDEVIEEETWI